MPGGDGTGPMGLGFRTGRGAGYCAGYAVPGYANPGFGRGRVSFGRGRGGGRGYRNRYYATGVPGWQVPDYRPGAYGNYPEPAAEEEKQYLKTEAEALKRELSDVQARIGTLEKNQGNEDDK